ncbi:aspartic peptidase domain-containing protein [Mycena albidolilacea]|uniref:Aspartic peptidase domain-containing protein n=1 Tax=Mycena albidolilacea TaxID=1033008 RepID=A0AAD7EZD5_9AGAR|nr:aspartic peptidase domain-containing protein [Mycena albidolilacea]
MSFEDPPPRRTLRTRDSEGTGGPDGVVLPLQYVSDGPYDVSYTLPVLVGSDSNPQNLSLQVDTGSSDLWIASSSCSSSVCGNAPLYTPTTAIPTNLDFSINYLVGNVSGPILWDGLTVGGYSIESQALAAADTIEAEPLKSQFSGVLGLALPTDSIIADEIPPQIGDTPDGAVWTSNLFGITPVSNAPSARFLSIALERPGSDAVPSVLGIGRHPAALVPDPSKIAYDALYAPSPLGPLFWKTAVRGITVYTNTSRMPIPLGRGASGVYHSAVLDTGVPIILTTTDVANAIYGAIGVQPRTIYYLPCTTPLNLTFSLDDRDEIPIHPLDLSTPPGSNAPDPNSCIGLIQTSADATLRNPTSVVGDMVLGVAFLRNVYTVLAYDVPASNGSFPTLSLNSTVVRPRLGLLGLTDPTVALDEFHRVRVLNQPLSDANPTGSATDAGGARKPSVGIDVLIALGGFVGLCLLLFGLRWVFVRRSLRRGTDGDDNLSARDAKFALGGYQLAQRGPGANDGLPTEDELRQRRYDAYMHSLHTVSTDRTQFEPMLDDGGTPVKDGAVKFPHAEPVQQLGQEQELPASPLPPVSPRDHSPLLAEHSPDLRHGRVLSVNLPLLPDAGPGAEEGTMAGVGTAFARGRSASQRLSTTTSVSRSPAPEP